jgi:leucyl-tRNA synthetase
LTDEAPSEAILRRAHESIKKVTEDLDALKFNTAIAQMMIFVNDLTKEEKRSRAALEILVLLLAPFAPHLAEELWATLGHKTSLAYAPWPKAEARYLVRSEVEIVVQVNGKVRGKIVVPASATAESLESLARAAAGEWLQDKTVVKVIAVPNKLVNFVVK